MAMKAIGDKVTFIEAKIMGTGYGEPQAGAITHDRLSGNLLVRDIDERLKKNPDYASKANLILPRIEKIRQVEQEEVLHLIIKRMVILNPPRALMVHFI